MTAWVTAGFFSFAAELIKKKTTTFEFVSRLNSNMSVTLFCVNTLKEQRTAARKSVHKDDRRKEGLSHKFTFIYVRERPWYERKPGVRNVIF